MMSLLPNTVSPFQEMLSYEALWMQPKASFKTLAEMFRKSPGSFPSKLIREIDNELFSKDLLKDISRYLKTLNGFGICVRGTIHYPKKILDADHPPEVFYYKGNIGLLEQRSVSIVGARKCTPEGAQRAAQLSRELTKKGFAVVSGLAEGIDTAAMTACIGHSGNTIGVIGTPINEFYPKQNKQLQETIARDHLVISQVPFYHYKESPFPNRKFHFPSRNEIMSAISEATIIVEASDTSGSLTQARACLKQGRKLFILQSCFDRRDISWPHTYLKRGAIKVKVLSDIISNLE